ncbi:MAG: type II toxin-antitoxin system RelE/ParE family toxin [Terriglobia bacterium]|jgi:proteic killer suppression protein
MIIRFRHKGLERLFASGEPRGVNAQQAKRLRRLLASLSTATSPLNMNIAGYQLHPLVGERKGEWAVSVSGNWRLVFRFDGENATDVDLVDYH